MKKLLLFACSICLMALPPVSLAVGPGSGSKTKHGVRIGKCQADSVTVKWNLDSLMGEATVSGSYKWTGDRNCTLPSSTTVWLKVKENGGGGYGNVRLSPVTPKANKSYGYNTTGSPSWKQTLCGYQGTSRTSCLSSSEAKRMWKNSHVSDFVIQW